MSKEISAGMIIYRRTKEGIKFLLLYHGREYWNFPKGKIENKFYNELTYGKETSFQAALREVKEETGLGRNELRFCHYFKTSERFTFWRPAKRDLSHIDRERKQKQEKVFKTIIFYLAETRKKAIKISEAKEGQPHEGFAWFTHKEAMKVLSQNKGSQRILTQANDFLRRQSVKNRG